MFSTVSILGCGWLGLPLAAELVRAGYNVKGSTTSPAKRTLLEANGVAAYTIRLQPQPEGDDLTAFWQTDALVIAIPPRAGQQGDAFYPQQIRHLAEALKQLPSLPYLILISSTSVYPEHNREVTEAEVVLPNQSAAPAFVEAEQIILQLGNATILRCGGLLGYDRIPGKYVAGKQNITTGSVPVNYIHQDDGVGLLVSLLNRPQPGQTFNAVAPLHPTREEVYRKSCAAFGYAMPTFAEPVEPVPFKVVSGQKLLDAVPYLFKYGDPLQFAYGIQE